MSINLDHLLKMHLVASIARESGSKSPAALIEPRNLPRSFAHLGLFLEVVTLVAMGLSFSNPNLNLHSPALEIHSQTGKSAAFLIQLLLEFEELFFMNQQLPWTPWSMLKILASRLPRLNVTTEKPKLAVVDAGIGISNIGLAISDGLHFRPFEHQTGLKGFRNVKIPPSLLIGREIFRHDRSLLGLRSLGEGGLLLVGWLTSELDLAFDDLE